MTGPRPRVVERLDMEDCGSSNRPVALVPDSVFLSLSFCLRR